MFALCANLAAGVVDTDLFVLGDGGLVPSCERCAGRLGYELIPATFEAVETELPADVGMRL